MTIRTLILATALAATTVALAAPDATAAPAPTEQVRCSLPGYGPGRLYHPHIDPSRFGPGVDNPWFPLEPGSTYVYAGTDSGAHVIDVFAPSRSTRVVDGVRTRVVHDEVLSDGVLSERTIDYYAQDVCGNVWYFGEDTALLDKHGSVISREGTWHAGVHGAQPGVYMQADPELGRRFRQEWRSGVAEDSFVAVSRSVSTTVPYGSFRHALRTHETTALEPGVLDTKVYARGVGELVERTIRGGSENLALVSVTR